MEEKEERATVGGGGSLLAVAVNAWSYFVTRRWLLYSVALLVRVVLLLYGNWQDSNMAVKYTDVDYLVFSEAAEFVAQGGSPYERSTYRYTPALAWMMVANCWWRPFGKWLFVAADIAIGELLHRVLSLMVERRRRGGERRTVGGGGEGERKGGESEVRRWSPLLLASLEAVWLLNPISINVSTRGNAESLVSLLVLLSLYLVMRGSLTLAAIVYGFAVHFKIYPLIFCIALYLYIDSEASPSFIKRIGRRRGALAAFFTPNRLYFTALSAGTFFLVSALMYYIYGFEFLWETYLYHVVRKDHRHNFSIYFYQIYLSTGGERLAGGLQALSGVLAFLPQFLLVIAFSFVFYRDLPFCLFVQTSTFVIFNKVCTVQYFIWYFSLLPLVLVHTSLSLKKGASMVVIWFVTQGLWLYYAYRLEFLGENTFYSIWVASLVFFSANMWILMEFLTHHNPPKLHQS